MRLRQDPDARAALRDLRRDVAGPERLARMVKFLQRDLERFPFAWQPPAPVLAALRVWEDAVEKATTIMADLEIGKEGVDQAHAKDVAEAARALAAGKPLPKMKQPKSEEEVAALLLACEAAEKLLSDSHAALVDAAKAAWCEWRRSMIEQTTHAREKASQAFSDAQAAIEAARAAIAGVPQLDAEMVGRYPDLAREAEAEEIAGLNWYESTHTPARPLARIRMQRGQVPAPSKAMTVALDLGHVLSALGEALADQTDWSATAWLPPGDPERDQLMHQPVDLSAPWVRAALAKRDGTHCRVCGQQEADVVAELEGAGQDLVLVHRWCKGKEPDAKELKRKEREEKLRRRGFDAQPGQPMQPVEY